MSRKTTQLTAKEKEIVEALQPMSLESEEIFLKNLKDLDVPNHIFDYFLNEKTNGRLHWPCNGVSNMQLKGYESYLEHIPSALSFYQRGGQYWTQPPGDRRDAVRSEIVRNWKYNNTEMNTSSTPRPLHRSANCFEKGVASLPKWRERQIKGWEDLYIQYRDKSLSEYKKDIGIYPEKVYDVEDLKDKAFKDVDCFGQCRTCKHAVFFDPLM